MRKKVLISLLVLSLIAALAIMGGCAAKPSEDSSAKDKGTVANTTNYPNKPINMIIAFTAGGSSDVQARIVEKYWKQEFGQPLVFVYKTGAGGAIGFNEIAKAPKDGYTIGGINVPHIILQPLGEQAQFTIDDFEYLCQVVNDPQVFAVKKGSPYKSVDDFIKAAKAQPGKLTIGIVGTFTGQHVALLDLMDLTGIKVTMVPFKGAADQNAALLGNQIDAMLGNLNDVTRDLEHISVLAQASEKRHHLLPDIPTFKELGINLVSDIRRGFAAPKGTDQAIVKRLREGFQKICNNPDYLKDMEKIGQPSEYMSGEEFDKFTHEMEKHYKEVLEKHNLLKK